MLKICRGLTLQVRFPGEKGVEFSEEAQLERTLSIEKQHNALKKLK